MRFAPRRGTGTTNGAERDCISRPTGIGADSKRMVGRAPGVQVNCNRVASLLGACSGRLRVGRDPNRVEGRLFDPQWYENLQLHKQLYATILYIVSRDTNTFGLMRTRRLSLVRRGRNDALGRH